MTFLFRFELVVILGIHTYLNMGARPWIYVAQIYNRLGMPRSLDVDVYYFLSHFNPLKWRFKGYMPSAWRDWCLWVKVRHKEINSFL